MYCTLLSLNCNQKDMLSQKKKKKNLKNIKKLLKHQKLNYFQYLFFPPVLRELKQTIFSGKSNSARLPAHCSVSTSRISAFPKVPEELNLLQPDFSCYHHTSGPVSPHSLTTVPATGHLRCFLLPVLPYLQHKHSLWGLILDNSSLRWSQENSQDPWLVCTSRLQQKATSAVNKTLPWNIFFARWMRMALRHPRSSKGKKVPDAY